MYGRESRRARNKDRVDLTDIRSTCYEEKMPTNFTVVPVEDCNASGSNYGGNNPEEERRELLFGPSSGKNDLENPVFVNVAQAYTGTHSVDFFLSVSDLVHCKQAMVS